MYSVQSLQFARCFPSKKKKKKKARKKEIKVVVFVSAIFSNVVWNIELFMSVWLHWISNVCPNLIHCSKLLTWERLAQKKYFGESARKSIWLYVHFNLMAKSDWFVSFIVMNTLINSHIEFQIFHTIQNKTKIKKTISLYIYNLG